MGFKISKLKGVKKIMYFVKTAIPNAVLRIQAGEYEVSLAGDDSCGAMSIMGDLI